MQGFVAVSGLRSIFEGCSFGALNPKSSKAEKKGAVMQPMGRLTPAEAPWCSPCKPVGEDVLIDMEPRESFYVNKDRNTIRCVSKLCYVTYVIISFGIFRVFFRCRFELLLGHLQRQTSCGFEGRGLGAAGSGISLRREVSRCFDCLGSIAMDPTPTTPTTTTTTTTTTTITIDAT